MCSRTILREVRCWLEATQIRAECRRNRPVVSFGPPFLPSQEFTVDCSSTFFCRVQRRQSFLRYIEKSLVISYRRQPRAGYIYWAQGQGLQRGRDQFDANACGLVRLQRVGDRAVLSRAVRDAATTAFPSFKGWCQYPHPRFQGGVVTLMAEGVPVVAASFNLPVGGSRFCGPGWLPAAQCGGVLPNDADTAHGVQDLPTCTVLQY